MLNGLSFFKDTYEDCLLDFRSFAESSGGELRSHQISEEHSFNSLYLPPKKNKNRLLILTSGIHGIEGFTGSALQRYFLANNFFDLKDENTGILLIHGINSYGFKNKRRVTQNNVDLNRNFDTSDELFNNVNSSYAEIYKFLNPESPYTKPRFYTTAIRFILKYGMNNLRKGILKGQYQFPEGIFFGGKKFEPQVSLIKDIVTSAGSGFEKILLVDLHTGYGKKGKLHLLGDRSPYIDQKFMHEVFYKSSVEYGDEKDFYAVTGGFTVFLAKLFHGKSKFAGIVFEFGTIDSQKPMGSLDSLFRMINENNDTISFEEMSYPKSPEWRKAVIYQFEAALKQSFLALQ